MESDDIFRFRRALPSNKKSVESLCAKIWEGEDYLVYELPLEKLGAYRD